MNSNSCLLYTTELGNINEVLQQEIANPFFAWSCAVLSSGYCVHTVLDEDFSGFGTAMMFYKVLILASDDTGINSGLLPRVDVRHDQKHKRCKHRSTCC